MDFESLTGIANRIGTAVVGDTVTLHPSKRTIKGVFEEPTESEPIAGYVVDLSKPRLTVTEEDYRSIFSSELLEVRGGVYSIAKPIPDGSGMVVLILSSDQPSNASSKWL